MAIIFSLAIIGAIYIKNHVSPESLAIILNMLKPRMISG